MKASSAAVSAAFTGPRAALVESQRLIADLRRQAAEAAEPNPRLEGLLDAEVAAQAAVDAVGEQEAAALRTWLDHGGAQPAPAAAKREAALRRLEVARRNADVARRADADRQATLGRLAHLTRDALKARQAIVAEIILTEAGPDVLRRYRKAYLDFMASYALVRGLVMVAHKLGTPMTPDVHAGWPLVINAPNPSNPLGVTPEPFDLTCLHKRATDAWAVFGEALATDAGAQLADFAS